MGGLVYFFFYSGRFFNLLCMMEHIDVVLKWYKKLIPSVSALNVWSHTITGLKGHNNDEIR